ncbi:MAG: thiamine pyrophosphate-dependent enzyme, partial [Geminicoccaceae bacterium]
KKVIAIDGDGSVLTNLGTLPTIANNVADNFILLIIDNGSYGSTGDQPTYAGKKTSLTAVAKACGCENVIECQAEDTGSAIQTALDSNQMTIIVCKCESGNVKVPVITMDPVVIRDRFMKSVQA